MKKIITTALILAIFAFTLSLAVPVFACAACAGEAEIDGMTPEMPVHDDGHEQSPNNSDNTSSDANTDTADDEDTSNSGEWTVMIIAIVALSIMTGGIVYMTTKSWDGKKNTSNTNEV